MKLQELLLRTEIKAKVKHARFLPSRGFYARSFRPKRFHPQPGRARAAGLSPPRGKRQPRGAAALAPRRNYLVAGPHLPARRPHSPAASGGDTRRSRRAAPHRRSRRLCRAGGGREALDGGPVTGRFPLPSAATGLVPPLPARPARARRPTAPAPPRPARRGLAPPIGTAGGAFKRGDTLPLRPPAPAAHPTVRERRRPPGAALSLSPPPAPARPKRGAAPGADLNSTRGAAAGRVGRARQPINSRRRCPRGQWERGAARPHPPPPASRCRASAGGARAGLWRVPSLAPSLPPSRPNGRGVAGRSGRGGAGRFSGAHLPAAAAGLAPSRPRPSGGARAPRAARAFPRRPRAPRAPHGVPPAAPAPDREGPAAAALLGAQRARRVWDTPRFAVKPQRRRGPVLGPGMTAAGEAPPRSENRRSKVNG